MNWQDVSGKAAQRDPLEKLGQFAPVIRRLAG